MKAVTLQILAVTNAGAYLLYGNMGVWGIYSVIGFRL
jgi:hypothetical protein